MPKSRVIARAEPRPPRFRNMITAIMLVLMTIMIVRDVLAVRFQYSHPFAAALLRMLESWTARKY